METELHLHPDNSTNLLTTLQICMNGTLDHRGRKTKVVSHVLQVLLDPWVFRMERHSASK